MKRSTLYACLAVAAIATALGGTFAIKRFSHMRATDSAAAAPSARKPPVAGDALPAVSVVRAAPADLREVVLVTGSLVAREEILVGPELEGLRVVEVLAEEGQQVTRGQTLARLVSDTLDAQMAQNEAGLARSAAAIAQARSSIAQAEARRMEARNAYERAKPLKQSGTISESVLDQREAAARTAEAQLVAARDGLALAEAERAQIEAQRRELAWRRSRTEVTAPADGLVSRRNARVGAMAAGAAEPMFRIIAKSEIELDAEVTEARLTRIREGQKVTVEVAGLAPVGGTVRLVSPEVDKTTRLGKVKVFIGAAPGLRIGAFGRGHVETAVSRGLAVPAAAVLYGEKGAGVQVVRDGLVALRPVTLGLAMGQQVEVRDGIAEGDLVVARSGTFLRDGDRVRPLLAGEQTSEAR
jgi:RND family efflux transporter MFP subunit